MAKRTITLARIEDAVEYGRGQYWAEPPDDPLRPDPRDYVSFIIDGSPFERLLWREIKHIERRTHMTDWQSAVFECYLRGLSIRETAAVYQRTESTIHYHLRAAFARAERFPNRGLLTVMIEELGWTAVKETLADKLQARKSREVLRNEK